MGALFVMWWWQCWHAAEPIFTNLAWDQTLDMLPLDINKTASQRQCTVTVPVHHDPWIWSAVLFLHHFYLFVHLVVATEWKLQWTKKMLLQKTHYSVDLQFLFIPALHKLSKVVNLIEYKAKQVWCSTESQWQSYDNTLKTLCFQ